MNDIIHLLPDSVANQIAAGEVIQRPASVVKELVENAIDAGATSIQIIITDAGRTLIQVVDNGSGMSDTDARLAFERHATSKISQADDLFSLRTMGFRGEALASIAAVAQVDMRSKRKDAELGTRIHISGSKVESQAPEACADGTNLMVKNLFFNVPARRKFLKKDAVELANIVREFERLVLVNPSVDFTLTSNGSMLHRLTPGGFKQRIIELFGKSLDKQLIEVGVATSVVEIDGFIGRPEFARRRNPMQYFFVNGRHMRHPYFHRAVMQCFEQLIPADQQPNYFLNFKVDPNTIDVNIHPTKNEIKFENESAVWQILTAAIRDSLGRFNAVPGIDFEAVDAPDIPVFNPNASAQHGIELDRSYNPFAEPPQHSPMRGGGGAGSVSQALRASVDRNWTELYRGLERRPDSQSDFVNPSESTVPSAINDAAGERTLDLDDATEQTHNFAGLQIKSRFILLPSASGVMVIDQHRAHVRVLYEQFMSRVDDSELPVQRLLFPDMVTLTPDQNVMLGSLIDEITATGFDLSYVGDNSWSINGVPVLPGNPSPSDTLLQILDCVGETGGDVNQDIRARIALALARAAAIPSGRHLAPGEIDHLVADLFRLSTPNYTPDGQQIMTIIPVEDLEKMLN